MSPRSLSDLAFEASEKLRHASGLLVAGADIADRTHVTLDASLLRAHADDISRKADALVVFGTERATGDDIAPESYLDGYVAACLCAWHGGDPVKDAPQGAATAYAEGWRDAGTGSTGYAPGVGSSDLVLFASHTAAVMALALRDNVVKCCDHCGGTGMFRIADNDHQPCACTEIALERLAARGIE